MKDLRSGIEHLKQAKDHMSKANGIMSDHISKLKALEEENAALKAELDDRKGNAEGFQPDAYMKLPLDADGVPIRFGDVVWFVGECVDIARDYPLNVAGFVTILGTTGTFIETREYPDGAIEPESLTHKKPEQADSWEKLEEDANLGRRDYCERYRLDECDYNMRMHMLARAKKLAGIEEDEQR